MAIDPKTLAQARMAKENMQTRSAAALERHKPLMDAEKKRMQDYYANQLAESHARMKASRDARDAAQGNVGKKAADNKLVTPAAPATQGLPDGITPLIRGLPPPNDFAPQADTTGMDKTAIGIDKTASPAAPQAPQDGMAAMKRGGAVKKMASGGMVRGNGCAVRGKTRGRMV